MNEQEETSLQARMLRMKAITFSEQRQHRIIANVFNILAAPLQRQLFCTQLYNKKLYAKSFKGIIEFIITQRQRLEEAEQQRRAKQAQEREKNNAAQQQQISKIVKMLQNSRKKVALSKFCKYTRQDVLQRKQKQKQTMLAYAEPSKNTNNIDRNYKTEFPFQRKEGEQSERNTPFDRSAQNFLQNSRRSQASQGYATQDQFKRKFAAIKTLPPKPPISTELLPQQKKSIKEVPPSNKQQENKPKDIIINDLVPKQEKSSPISIPQESKQKDKQEPIPHIARMKDKILGLLSEIKMVQIMSLTEIIQQYSKAFKNQANIAENRQIKESLKVLQRISGIK